MTWYEDEIHQLENKVKALSAVYEEASPGGIALNDRVHNRGYSVGNHPIRTVFYGSSSVRLWTTLATDFPDADVLNLGFGGSTLEACVWFFERVLVPASPESVVFYAGDNDLGDGRTPEEVYRFFCAFAQKMSHQLPGVPLAFLTIKISPARWNIAHKIRIANGLIAQEIGRYPNFRAIDTTDPLLDADGRPRRELFENDGLHLSPSGYRVWQQVLQPLPGVF